jgi:hypothetical protein
MTLRSDILSRFTGDAATAPFFLPDLTLWHKWHAERGTFPDGWSNPTLIQAARRLNTAIWAVARPWQVSTPGIPTHCEETAEERIIRHETPGRALTTRFTRGPDGDWWLTEYPVKSADDLTAARALVEARTYMPAETGLAALREAVGDDGVVALELPMRAYSDVLHALLGWSEGLMLFAGDGRPMLLEILAVMEEKLQALTEQVAALPGDLLLAPDNLDGQYVSPKVFRDHFALSYRRTADSSHRHGKPLVVHVGGPIRRILPLLADAGVDGVEGIAGPPQSDATLAEARQLAGPGITLWGGIPQDLLQEIHSQKLFEAGVADALQQVKGDARMILGIADRVPADADFARLRAIPELTQMPNADHADRR